MRALVIENKFMGARRHQLFAQIEMLFCPGLERAAVMSPGGVPFWTKYVGAMDSFVADKEEFSLEITISSSVKARDPFLWIRKRMNPMVDLEAIRQSKLAITRVGEREAPTPSRTAPS